MSTPRTQDERPDGQEADPPQPEGTAQDAPTQEAPDVDPTGPADDGEPRDLDAELAEAKDRWLRARAELENVRRRARLDVDEARDYGTGHVLLEMLPVLDALQRALAALPEGEEGPVLEGLRLTEQQFIGTLERLGVTAVPAEPGSALDPECHRALMEQPTDDQEPGTIVSEVVRGYRLRDRLLREAHVVVAKATE